MSRYIFLFDLDSTITAQEILPTISKELGIDEKKYRMTENTVHGELPFKQSFLKKVELFREIPVSRVCRLVSEIKLNNQVVDFIRNNKERCYIVTYNLDIWIEPLMKMIGMDNNIFCSRASVKDDYIRSVFSVIDKGAVINQMVMPSVAIGDGNNDAEMIEAAEIGIGYGGVHNIASSVLACATHAVYDEEKLVYLLKKLL